MTLGWWITVGYFAVVLLVWRRTSFHLIRGVVGDDPEDWDGEDVALGVMFGFFVSLAWPIAVPARLAYLALGPSAFVSLPRHLRRKMELEEREHRVRERESRISQLEREAGLR